MRFYITCSLYFKHGILCYVLLVLVDMYLQKNYVKIPCKEKVTSNQKKTPKNPCQKVQFKAHIELALRFFIEPTELGL